MNINYMKISVSKIMKIVAILCILFSIINVYNYSFVNMHHKMNLYLEILHTRKPADIPSPVWKNAVMWTKNACGSVFFSSEHVEINEFKEFCNKLEIAVNNNPDINSLDWIWDRLAQSGRHGKQYVMRHRANYEDVVSAWRAQVKIGHQPRQPP